jgi:hypothetical protein
MHNSSGSILKWVMVDCFYRSCISFCRMWNNMTKLPRVSTRLTSLIFCSISSLLSLIHHTQLVRETCFRECCHWCVTVCTLVDSERLLNPFYASWFALSPWLSIPIYINCYFHTFLATLMMEAAHFFRTLMNIYRSVWHYLEDSGHS